MVLKWEWSVYSIFTISTCLELELQKIAIKTEMEVSREYCCVCGWRLAPWIVASGSVPSPCSGGNSGYLDNINQGATSVSTSEQYWYQHPAPCICTPHITAWGVGVGVGGTLVKSLGSCTRPIVRSNTADIQRDIDGMTRSFTFFSFCQLLCKLCNNKIYYAFECLNTKQNILLIYLIYQKRAKSRTHEGYGQRKDKLGKILILTGISD